MEPAPLFRFVFVFTFPDALQGLLSDCTQVIAPYLITLRVAKRRALMSEPISGTAGSIHFRSQGSTDGDGSLPGNDTCDAMEVNGEELIVDDENAIEEVPL